MENLSCSSLPSFLLQIAVNITVHQIDLTVDIDGNGGSADKLAVLPAAVMSTSRAPLFSRSFTRRIHLAPTRSTKPKFICGDLPYTPIIILWLLVIVTVVGNLLAIIAFIRNEKIRSKIANHFIFNLSVADLLVGVISMPVNNLNLHFGYWPFGEVCCKLWLILDYTICFQGMTAVVFISMDRYCWVKWPLKYMRLMTRRRAIGTITIAWCAGFAYYLIHVLCWEHFEGISKVDYDSHCDLEIIGGLAHAVIAVILEFFLPLTTVVVVNGIVYHIVRTKFGGKEKLRRERSSQKLNIQIKQSAESPIPSISSDNQLNQSASPSTSSDNQLSQSESSNTSSDNQISANSDNQIIQSASSMTSSKEPARKKYIASPDMRLPKPPSMLKLQTVPRHWKTAATLSFMVVTLIVLWLPYQAILLLAPVCRARDSDSDSDCVTCLMWESVNYLLWSTAAINPIIYAYTNIYYRKEMLNMLCFCCRRKLCYSLTTSPDSSKSKSPPQTN